MYRHKKTIDCEGGAGERIRIVPVGDMHWFTESTDFMAFRRMVATYAPDPKTFFFGMGDWWDCIYALKGEKRFDARAETRTLDEVKDTLDVEVNPISDRFLVALDGNHEDNLNQWGLGSPVIWWAKKNRVPYGGYSCFFDLVAHWKNKEGKRIKTNTLSFYLHHGFFSGRKKGAKINNMEDAAASYNAQVYIWGHSHDLIASKRVMMDKHGVTHKTFVNSGTFNKTNTWGATTYGEKRAYPPTVCGDVVEILWYPWQRHGKMNGKIKILM